MGAAFGESPEQRELLADATSAAKLGSHVPYGFASETPSLAADAVDPHTAVLSIDNLVGAAHEINQHIRRLAPDADPQVMCAVTTRALRIATSEGMDAEESSTQHVFRIILPFADRGTDIGAYGLALGTNWSPPSRAWLAELVEQRTWGTGPSLPVTGKLPALLSPQVSNLLLIPLIAGISGQTVAQATSPLRDKIGKPLLSSNLTVREDPICPALAHPRSFDDEGIACQPRNLIDRGMLTSYVTDLRSAFQLGQSSTGNAVRRTLFSQNIDDVPMPSVLGAVIEPGDMSYRELIAGMGDGLLVTFVRGLHSGNLVHGDFSVLVDGFRVRNGRIKGYLAKTMISGNIYDVFRHVRALSQETEATAQGALNVSALAPYILLDSVRVTVG